MRMGWRESWGRLVAAVAVLQLGFGYSDGTASTSTSISITTSPPAPMGSTSSVFPTNPPQKASSPAGTSSSASRQEKDDANQTGSPNFEAGRTNTVVTFEFKWGTDLVMMHGSKSLTVNETDAAVIRIGLNWQVITWSATSPRKIGQLKLHKRTEKSSDVIAQTNQGDDGRLMGVMMPHGSLKETRLLIEGKSVRRQVGPELLFTASLAANGSGSIDFIDDPGRVKDILSPLSSVRTDILFFEAVLQNNGGSSFSRQFALTTDEEEWRAVVNKHAFLDPSPAQLENITQLSDTPKDGSPENTAISSASAAESGLPTGAKIGIAVGAGVAGLLILVVLVWLAVRWRRKRKSLVAVGPYGPNGRTDELMAQKEASAGVDAPHSPYSDDGEASGSGSGYQDRTGMAAAAVAPHHQHQHSLDHSRASTPFLDRSISRPGGGPGTPSVRTASVAHTEPEISRTTMASPIPGRATPRALTTPYAHLVEEGMTEEEIRRLEEEERQLDAAIEQAGRR